MRMYSITRDSDDGSKRTNWYRSEQLANSMANKLTEIGVSHTRGEIEVPSEVDLVETTAWICPCCQTRHISDYVFVTVTEEMVELYRKQFGLSEWDSVPLEVGKSRVKALNRMVSCEICHVSWQTAVAPEKVQDTDTTDKGADGDEG